MITNTTIVAISTAIGGAISVVRMSGDDTLHIITPLFSKSITEPRKCYYGNFIYNGQIIDEVIATYYKAPYSYTGEDMIEISCHGSRYISNEIIRILIKNGASAATAGEFTKRAFLNGKMDLSRAEAVGDLIAADSKTAAEVALSQMRGGYSQELSRLREKLLHTATMLELELDFSEEDVEFASREEFRELLVDINTKCHKLSDSFSLGNVLKNGISVAIVGKPNVGKSTILNTLVKAERSIVSDIAGTTRDYIEETINLDGVLFRFIDTAGIRNAKDSIEALGVERSFEQISKAQIIINVADDENEFEPLELQGNQKELKVLNKSDKYQSIENGIIYISAKYNLGIELLKKQLIETCDIGQWSYDGIVVSNARHYELLCQASKSIEEILNSGFNGTIPYDIINHLLQDAIQSIGTITGQFTTDEILSNVFKNFCIGK